MSLRRKLKKLRRDVDKLATPAGTFESLHGAQWRARADAMDAYTATLLKRIETLEAQIAMMLAPQALPRGGLRPDGARPVLLATDSKQGDSDGK